MSHKEPELREQDRWLPIANVARLMKNTLPASAKVSKDAKECMQECVSEFISFITSEASDNCSGEKRKTINGEDILLAMTALGFENYSEALKIYLTKYRQQQALKQERGEMRKRQPSSTSAGSSMVNNTMNLESDSANDNGPMDDNNNDISMNKTHHITNGMDIGKAHSNEQPLDEENNLQDNQFDQFTSNPGDQFTANPDDQFTNNSGDQFDPNIDLIKSDDTSNLLESLSNNAGIGDANGQGQLDLQHHHPSLNGEHSHNSNQ